MRAWLEAAAARHPRRVERITTAVIVALGVAIAWAFAATVLRHTRPMALPLDDSYGHLSWARQLARGQRGAPAGDALSVLWALVLAPIWALGARGPALVWAAFVVSSALHVVTALGVYRVVLVIAGRRAAVLAAWGLLAIAPLAAVALAGTEAAIATALLVLVAAWLIEAPPTGPPAIRMGLCLGAAGLAGGGVAAIGIALSIAAAIQRIRQRAPRAALAWLAPVLAPLVVGVLLPGGLAPWWPGAIVAEGIDGVSARAATLGRMVRAMCWDAAGPLVWPRALTLLWIVGAVQVLRWARREARWSAGVLIVGAPVVVMLGAVESIGGWRVDHGRFLAPAVPCVLIAVGCALGPRGRVARWRGVVTLACLAGIAGFTWRAIPRFAIEARRFAQSAADLNAGLVAAAGYVQRKQPDGPVVAEPPGAVSYVADVPVARLPTRDGPGTVFEHLERTARLAPDPRPTRFVTVVDPRSASAIAELSGDSVFRVAPRSLFGARLHGPWPVVEVRIARWDHVGTGERPLNDPAGWAIVDRIDIADLASEAAHDWTRARGRLEVGPTPAGGSLLEREVGAQGLVIDGGRVIHGGRERFTVTLDATRPARLVLRTGGAQAVHPHDVRPVDRAMPIRLLDDAGRELARGMLPPPDGRLVEVSFALPAGAPRVLRTDAPRPYPAFHWFVLQPP